MKIKISQEKIPDFLFVCHVDNINPDINKELNGWIKIIKCDTPIKSVEMQFVRNEKVILSNGESLVEMSEIQNLQIGDGDVVRNNEIPLNMLFPRFFSCANLESKIVCLTFDINIIVVLNTGLVITENVPLNLWRS